MSTMPQHTPGRRTVQREVNDYSIVLHQPGRAPRTLAGYIECRADAVLMARATDLLDAATEALSVLQDVASEAGDTRYWNDGGAGRACTKRLRAVLARIEKGR
jgi:hypothetical protein